MVIDPSKLEPRPLQLETDLKNFDCSDPDLNEFLLVDAIGYQEQYLAQTTLLYFDNKLVGYFTLACDAIRLDIRERAVFHKRKRMYSYPAIKVARMAFVKECQGQGCGTYILDVVKGLVHKLNKFGTGCRFITVDAYSDRIDFYLKRGFKYNIHEDYKEKKHPNLRLDVWSYFHSQNKKEKI